MHITQKINIFFPQPPLPVGIQLHQICQLDLCGKMKRSAQRQKMPGPQGSMPPPFPPLTPSFWRLLKYMFSDNAICFTCGFSP